MINVWTNRIPPYLGDFSGIWFSDRAGGRMIFLELNGFMVDQMIVEMI
jgi:hypothetical protein